jgi:hypothetical protein
MTFGDNIVNQSQSQDMSGLWLDANWSQEELEADNI